MWDILVNNAPSLRADVEALVWFHSAPCAQLLASVTVPVLTMVGETTFEVMHHASNAIADALPNATKVIVPGAQHGWEPTAMATRLAQFVLTQT